MRSSGQSLVEYGLIISLIAVVSIAGLQVLGNGLEKQLSGLAGIFTDNTKSVAVADSPNIVTGGDSFAGSGQNAPVSLTNTSTDSQNNTQQTTNNTQSTGTTQTQSETVAQTQGSSSNNTDVAADQGCHSSIGCSLGSNTAGY
jgi:Flp pilus assembly pilin Flp